jgi:hypothetical protein
MTRAALYVQKQRECLSKLEALSSEVPVSAFNQFYNTKKEKSVFKNSIHTVICGQE